MEHLELIQFINGTKTVAEMVQQSEPEHLLQLFRQSKVCIATMYVLKVLATQPLVLVCKCLLERLLLKLQASLHPLLVTVSVQVTTLPSHGMVDSLVLLLSGNGILVAVVELQQEPVLQLL